MLAWGGGSLFKCGDVLIDPAAEKGGVIFASTINHESWHVEDAADVDHWRLLFFNLRKDVSGVEEGAEAVPGSSGAACAGAEVDSSSRSGSGTPQGGFEATL